MRRSTGCALTIVMLMVAACGGGTDEGTESPSPTSVDEPTPTTAGAVSDTSPETAAPTTMAATTMAPTTAGDTSDPYDYGPSESDTTMAPATTAAAGGGSADTLAVSETEVGTFLTTGDGWSLYLFTVDEQGGGESACSDDCAAAWPPLTGEFTAGDGIDQSLLGSITRADGSEQVTYNGWPLYYFANDAEPGDTNGQGANDVWYLVTPEGEQVAAGGDAGGDTVVVSETDMGSFLTTGDGWSLYLFTMDEQGGGESTCSGDCAGAWPPLTGEFTAGEGVDSELMGTISRDDGSEQVTYNGWPLYYFANDAEPGETNGQGANDVWYLVTPEGEQVP